MRGAGTEEPMLARQVCSLLTKSLGVLRALIGFSNDLRNTINNLLESQSFDLAVLVLMGC